MRIRNLCTVNCTTGTKMEVTQKLTTQGTSHSSGHTHTEEEWTDDCGNVAVP